MFEVCCLVQPPRSLARIESTPPASNSADPLLIPNQRRKMNHKKNKKQKRGKNRKQAPTHPRPAALSTLRTSTPLFPASVRKRLPYYEPGIVLSGTAGVIAQYVFTANGIFDPNISGTGHQPLGFDTMMLYYEQYCVVASRVTVRACGNGAQAVNVSVCLAPDTSTLVLPDVVENGLITTTVLDGRGGGSSFGTGRRIGSLNLACDARRYFGRRTQQELLDDPTLQGTVAANPTEQVYFVINTWGFGAFTDNTAVEMDVTLEYDVIFWEPRKVSSQLRAEMHAAIERFGVPNSCNDSIIARTELPAPEQKERSRPGAPLRR